MLCTLVDLPDINLEDLFTIADCFNNWHGTCLLHSGGTQETAQDTFLALFPYDTITVAKDIIRHYKGDQSKKYKVSDPWKSLQRYFFGPLSKTINAYAFGWFGYGMGASADSTVKLPYHPSDFYDAYWQRCGIVVKMNHETQKATLFLDSTAFAYLEDLSQVYLKILSTPQGWQDLLSFIRSKSHAKAETNLDFIKEGSFTKEDYLTTVKQAQELIHAGEIYQVNLSKVFNLQGKCNPFSLFSAINTLNPAPFSAYFHTDEGTISCSSPERFLCKQGERLETRPIKGTIRRGATEAEDAKLKEKLLSCPKERAELLMITDLMRNDLSKVSQVGSVKTADMWRCDAYTNVFHLSSVIHSVVQPHLKPLEIVRACFPGGSVTGCPKLRAMEVIAELEKRPRGIYTGSIGYFTGEGDFDLNIAIRTLCKKEDQVSIQLGSGIVVDSQPEQEYDEVVAKGQSIFHTILDFHK